MNAIHRQFHDRGHGSAQGRGFSLVEVLMAIFILSIGLIMVASIFPVGAEWTRQNAEETIAGVVAENAMSIVRSRFRAVDFTGVNTSILGMVDLQPTALNPTPTKVPLSERAYQFGSAQPFPAPNPPSAGNPGSATYFWTMLARQTLTTNPTSQARNYDIYILVFKKGALEQQYSQGTILLGSRAVTDPNYVPCVTTITYSAGGSTPTFGSGANPRMGSIGIGSESGTVFRQSLGGPSSAPVAAPRPMLKGTPDTTSVPVTVSETVLYAPPADGGQVSPLVFVYQTTLSF